MSVMLVWPSPTQSLRRYKWTPSDAHPPDVDYDVINDVGTGRLSKYRTFCNPQAPPKCRRKKLNFCLEDYDYPETDVQVGDPPNSSQLVVSFLVFFLAFTSRLLPLQTFNSISSQLNLRKLFISFYFIFYFIIQFNNKIIIK